MPAKNTLDPQQFLEKITADFPDIDFVAASTFSWHAGKRHVSYRKDMPANDQSLWALLHELGHALLNHTDFRTDIELLKIEVAAWEEARTLGKRYDIAIDSDYVEDCLDSYRDWLHLRSTCPKCYERSLQVDPHNYRCMNCLTTWRVTRSRLCRPYRRRG